MPISDCITVTLVKHNKSYLNSLFELIPAAADII
jgi:hypothetical protein